MQLIKLSATDSTNAFLKELLSVQKQADFTVVTTDAQLKGRGQMGTIWEAAPGKNLTFSVLKNLDSLNVTEQFNLNILVSIAIYEVLEQYQVPDLRIKWPNDIMSGHSKICGILIENILSGHNIQSAIIGIGLNVNQLEFNALPNVSSLKLLMGVHFDLEELLQAIVAKLKALFVAFEQDGVDQLKSYYESLLFRKDKPSTFKDENGELFMGFINGVSDSGTLIILLEDNIKKEFNLKEVKLLY